MSFTLALAGDVLQHGQVVLAADGSGGDTNVNRDLLMYSSLVGVLLPPVIAVFNQPRFSPLARRIVILVLCVLASAGTVALEGQITTDRLVTSVLVVLVGAVAMFEKFWNTAARNIEVATQLGSQRTDQSA